MYFCRDCGETHTSAAPGGRCGLCGGQLVYNPYAAVTTLAEAVRKAEELERAQEIDAFILELPEGVVPEQRDKQFVFSSHELIRAGFHRRLQEFDLVRVAGIVFEILGYSYTGRVYIARVFTLEWPDTVADLPKAFRLPRRRKKKEEPS